MIAPRSVRFQLSAARGGRLQALTLLSAYTTFCMCCMCCAVVTVISGSADAHGNDMRGDAAQDTSWSAIRSIVETSCIACHREGGGAPFPFERRDDLVRRQRQIDIVLERGIMPPFHAREDSAGAAEDVMRLSDQDRAALRAWLRAGGPGQRGVDDAVRSDHLPPGTAPSSAKAALTLRMTEPYTVPAEGLNVTRTFVLPFDVSVPLEVTRAEVIVSEPAIARHAFLSIDLTGSARMLAEADPEPGYGAAADIALVHAGSFASWSLPFAGRDLAAGFVRELPARGDLLVQFDFHPVGRPVSFTFEVRLFVAARREDAGPAPEAEAVAPARPLSAVAMGTLRIDFPPGATGLEIVDEIVLPVDAAVVEIVPHGGAICRILELVALPPGGGWPAADGDGGPERPATSPQVLLYIEPWDANWHRTRTLLLPPELPAGTTLRLRIMYDNSGANPRNPFDPPRRVELGHGPGFEPGLLLVLLAPKDPEDAARMQRLHRSASLRRMRERSHWLRSGAGEHLSPAPETP